MAAPRAVPRSRAEEFEERDIFKGNKLRKVFDRAFKEMYESLATIKIVDMLILGQVRGIKEEVETMTRKKEKVADLLGPEIEEHSGLIIEGERRSYKKKLQQWRDEALCREIELMKLGRDEEATTKQRQIVEENSLKSAPLVNLSWPENFLSWKYSQ